MFAVLLVKDKTEQYFMRKYLCVLGAFHKLREAIFCHLSPHCHIFFCDVTFMKPPPPPCHTWSHIVNPREVFYELSLITFWVYDKVNRTQ